MYNAEKFKSVFEKEFIYVKGFLRNVGRYPDKIAIECPLKGRSWTYPEMDKECNKLANAMMDDGAEKGDVVVYQLLNRVEFAFIYIASQKIGVINSPINFRLSPGETAYILDDSKPKFYIFDALIADVAKKALEMATHKPERVVVVGELEEMPVGGAVAYEDYVSGRYSTPPPVEHPSGAFDEVTRLYTSGTTGMPKGVPLNNINEIMSAHDVIMHFPLSPLDKTMNMTPWFHRGGLHSGGPTPVFYVGAQAVPLLRFDPATVLDYVEKYKLTFLIGAPVTLKALYEEQQRKPRDLSSLKGIVTMGAPLEKSACIEFHRVLTPNIYNGYGTTEAFWNTFLRPYDLPEMAGSAGRSCTDDDVRVVKIYPDRKAEPDDLATKDGEEVGEVIVKAPGKCSYCYHNRPEEEEVFYKGWLYIGDLGTWDEKEFVTIVGRKDDMIISGAENIQPVQVEEVLNEHPKVKDCVVVGAPHEKWGEVVVAYVIPKDKTLTAKELDDFCLNHPSLARYKRPRYYRFVESLPFTATGKKQHYKVREQVVKDMAEGLLEKV